MIEITGAHPPEHRLKPGDVIMVHRELKDKQTGEPFTWKYLAMIVDGKRNALNRILIQHIILDDRDRLPTTLFLRDARVWYIPEEEWPDGVHVFRTKFILEGRVDIDL